DKVTPLSKGNVCEFSQNHIGTCELVSNVSLHARGDFDILQQPWALALWLLIPGDPCCFGRVPFCLANVGGNEQFLLGGKGITHQQSPPLIPERASLQRFGCRVSRTRFANSHPDTAI